MSKSHYNFSSLPLLYPQLVSSIRSPVTRVIYIMLHILFCSCYFLPISITILFSICSLQLFNSQNLRSFIDAYLRYVCAHHNNSNTVNILIPSKPDWKAQQEVRTFHVILWSNTWWVLWWVQQEYSHIDHRLQIMCVVEYKQHAYAIYFTVARNDRSDIMQLQHDSQSKLFFVDVWDANYISLTFHISRRWNIVI